MSNKKVTTLKKILNAGTGTIPEFNCDTKAIFDYEVLVPPENSAGGDSLDSQECEPVTFPDDRSLYKSVDSTKKCWPHGYGKPLELVFGHKFQLPLFEDCLKTMLVNEVSQFDVYNISELLSFPVVSAKLREISRFEASKHQNPNEGHCAHHSHCSGSGALLSFPELNDLMQKPRPIRIIFHLLKVLQSGDYNYDSWQLNDAQKLDCVDSLRAEGNEFFKEEAFEQAIEKYKQALGIIDKLMLKEKPNDSEWVELDLKNIPFYLNLSQCFLNINSFYEAAECASEVLKRDVLNEKALYRRAKARIGTWDLDLAEMDLKQLESSGCSISAQLIKSVYNLIKEKREQMDRDDRTFCKSIFARNNDIV